MSLYTLFSTFLMTALALVALRPVAIRVGLLDLPGGRKTHATPTPMIGGLGIYLGTLSICMLSPVIMNDYKILLALSGFVLLVGVLDDLYDIRVSLRMAMHATAAWVMADVAQIQLRSFGDILFTGPIDLGVLAVPITMFATVGVINAINMSDGLDGLSGGLSVIALLLLSIVALGAGQSAVLSFSQILIVSLLAFLAFNFRLLWKKSALIYLGDAGSTLLGFIIAWLVIAATQGNTAFIAPVYALWFLVIAATQGNTAFIAPVYALWFLAIPLMDTIKVMLSRPMRGRSPFSPGRDHLHHHLMNMGFDARQTVLLIHGAAMAMGGIGLLGHFAGAPESLMFVLFMLVFVVYFLASRRAVLHGNASETAVEPHADNR